LRAKSEEISVALGTVFLLNSVALWVFPPLGHWLSLTQEQFGIWAAVAIHDTSSVVGAAAAFGPDALNYATTLKLARALWIIPLAIGYATWMQRQSTQAGEAKVKGPWFILGFVAAMLANSYLPLVPQVAPHLVTAAKWGLTLTLFLIGTTLSYRKFRLVGWRPLVQGLALWLLVSGLSLWAVMVLRG
jgi:uncharacterized integral membrane protein (TIGR00698 family)